MPEFLTLPIYTHIHQYRYTHSDKPTVIYPQWLHFFSFLLPPYQTHPTNLGTTDSIMEHKAFYEGQVITKRLRDTPTRSLLCWLFKNFSYTLLMKKLFGSNNMFLYNLCHHMVFSLWDFPTNITLPPITLLVSVVTLAPHIGFIPQGFFFSRRANITCINLRYTHQTFFPYTVFECCHNIWN